MNAPSPTSTTAAPFDVQAVLDALCNWEEIESILDSGGDHWPHDLTATPKKPLDEVLLHRALGHPRPVYRMAAVHAGCHLPSVVERGLRDRFWRVRMTAALCGAASPEWLAGTVHDTSPQVRCAAATRPTMPIAALRSLIVDRVSSVRETAARHPSFVEVDLCALADHFDPAVRRVVARRSGTVATLERLAADPDPKVAEAVADNNYATARALHLITDRSRDPKALERVATHANTALEDLLALIEGGVREPASAMAKRSIVPEVLNALAQHPDASVRADLLTNGNLTAEALMLMPLDAPVAEHRAAAAHPNATWATCRRLAVHYLSSGHPGRRYIGVEMVVSGLARGDAETTVSAGSTDEAFDILFALFTGQRTDELRAWANGAIGPKWLCSYVLGHLGDAE